jgi:hypothetical protein
MARCLLLGVLGLLLASCDPVDPSEFHHKAAADAGNGTGCHFSHCTNGSDVETTTDTHGLEKGGTGSKGSD